MANFLRDREQAIAEVQRVGPLRRSPPPPCPSTQHLACGQPGLKRCPRSSLGRCP
jgi:hypothetical protein